jgi:hypothetical protein
VPGDSLIFTYDSLVYLRKYTRALTIVNTLVYLRKYTRALTIENTWQAMAVAPPRYTTTQIAGGTQRFSYHKFRRCCQALKWVRGRVPRMCAQHASRRGRSSTCRTLMCAKRCATARAKNQNPSLSRCLLTYMCVCVCVCMYVGVYVCVYVVCVCVCVYVCMCVCVYVCVYTHTHTYTHTFVYTHTHVYHLGQVLFSSSWVISSSSWVRSSSL